MARPARYNAEYFTHTADFRNDRRIKAIRARFGMAGYGLVLMILEVLTDADYTQLSTDELELELLAGDLGVSATEISSLLQLAEKIGFFARNKDGFLFCPDLNKTLEPVFEKRNRARNAAQQAKPEVSATETRQSVTETPQSKVKESKEEESKEKESKPSFQEGETREREDPPPLEKIEVEPVLPSKPPLDSQKKAASPAAHTGGAGPPAKSGRVQLFRETPYADLHFFKSAFEGSKWERLGVNFGYYHAKLLIHSDKRQLKMSTWIEYVTGWMIEDEADGKLRTMQALTRPAVNGHSPPNSQAQSRLLQYHETEKALAATYDENGNRLRR